MQLSIIIPTYNEEKGISTLLLHLQTVLSDEFNCEVIIVDGGSSDATLSVIAQTIKKSSLDIKVCESPKKGRASQMNFGASKAKGKWLYFLHADTFPPNNFDKIILNFVQPAIEAGSFRMKFDKNTVFFNFWSWFTRFKWNVASGGDQSLFILKRLFNQINGFDEYWSIMEDVDIVSRIKKNGTYKVVPQHVITSSRKYDQVGVFKLQAIFVSLQVQRIFGKPPEKLNAYYNKKLRADG